MLKKYSGVILAACCLLGWSFGTAQAKFTYRGAEAPRESRAEISVPAPSAAPAPPAEGKAQSAVSAALESASSQVQGPSSAPLPYSPASPAAFSPIKAEPLFTLREGSLREQIEAYATENNSTVSWKAAHDLMIRNTATFSGDFEKVMAELFGSLKESGQNLAAQFFRGNRLLLVTNGQR